MLRCVTPLRQAAKLSKGAKVWGKGDKFCDQR
jgi:hypothetical protein